MIWTGTWAVEVEVTPAGSWASGPVPAKETTLSSRGFDGTSAGAVVTTEKVVGPVAPGAHPEGMVVRSAVEKVQVTVFVAASNTPTTAAAWNTVFNLSLTNPTISGYTETVQSLGTVGSSKTIGSLTNGTLVTATLTNATATAFTLPTPVAGLSFLLSVQQPGTTGSGTYTFTSPSGLVVWPSAGTPAMTQGAGKRDLLSFVCIDGTNWFGSYTQGFTA